MFFRLIVKGIYCIFSRMDDFLCSPPGGGGRGGIIKNTFVEENKTDGYGI